MNRSDVQPKPPAPKPTALSNQQRDLVGAVIGLIVLHALMPLLGLWQGYWWAGVLITFFLIAVIAENVGQRVPVKHKPAYDRVLAVGFPVLLLIGWELIVGAEILNPRWFPPPTRVAGALWDLTINYDRFNESSLLGRFWLIPSSFAEGGWSAAWVHVTESHVFSTLGRVFIGFLIGSIPGVLIGIVMGINRTVRTMLDGTLSAIYVLPKIAIFPIMMLIFPDPFGEGPKVAVVAISAFFLVAISTMAGVRDIDPVFLQAGRNYGANRWQMFRHVIFPAALPVIFSGLRLALGTALIVIVAIEFVRADRGVGYIVLYYWQILVVEKMYAGLFVVMVLGVLLTYGLQWIERRVMPWRQDSGR